MEFNVIEDTKRKVRRKAEKFSLLDLTIRAGSSAARASTIDREIEKEREVTKINLLEIDWAKL